jgi:hypothetical protein
MNKSIGNHKREHLGSSPKKEKDTHKCLIQKPIKLTMALILIKRMFFKIYLGIAAQKY